MPPPSWDFRRGTIAVRAMVEVGAEHGLTRSECLEGTRITRADLDDPGARIEALQELAVARNMISRLGDRPGLGVAAGGRFTLGSAGILGFAMLSSPTVRDAVTVGLRYAALSVPFLRFDLREEEGGDHAGIVADDTEVPDDVREFFVERDLACIAAIVPTLLGYRLPGRLELRLDEVRGGALAALMPGAAITFGRPGNVLVFPRELLDERLPQADGDTARLCERHCRELLRQRRHRHGTAERVRSRLLADPGRSPSMRVVADELHLHPRTLRRHLGREGTSFRALLDEVRETLALELLGQFGLSVEEVAHRLGYAETASFTHAFTRWRGTPPSAHRRTSGSPI